MDQDRRNALSTEYGEVCSNFRTLTDIRFKLLGLLPIATAVAIALKVDHIDGRSFVFSLFGLIATIGLVTYNTRNDELYDELVRRAAYIERSLGLADGAFANRPRASRNRSRLLNLLPAGRLKGTGCMSLGGATHGFAAAVAVRLRHKSKRRHAREKSRIVPAPR
ncbi:hypothetical protein ACT4MK_38505 [Bradyrhizobium barranii]|uniref:hypothetical protein n=1 Tax=Bradyrhizobium TaxID=374 RepID=UPI003F29D6BD